MTDMCNFHINDSIKRSFNFTKPSKLRKIIPGILENL